MTILLSALPALLLLLFPHPSMDDDLRPGDLLFFYTGEKARHVGIYLGDGDFFHSSTSKGVTRSSMHADYWKYRLITIRRIDHPLNRDILEAAFQRYDPAGYGYGKAGPSRYDCSGLVWRVFRDAGIDLPRTTRKQMRLGSKVK